MIYGPLSEHETSLFLEHGTLPRAMNAEPFRRPDHKAKPHSRPSKLERAARRRQFQVWLGGEVEE